MFVAGRNWTVVLEKDEDDYFVATVSELPAVVTQGKTKEKALTNVREAITLYLDYLRKERKPLPKRVVETVRV